MDQNPTLNGVLPSTWESLCFFGFLEDVVFLFKMFLSICSMRNPLRLGNRWNFLWFLFFLVPDQHFSIRRNRWKCRSGLETSQPLLRCLGSFDWRCRGEWLGSSESVGSQRGWNHQPVNGDCHDIFDDQRVTCPNLTQVWMEHWKTCAVLELVKSSCFKSSMVLVYLPSGNLT